MLTAVIFDFDGVLVDSEPLHYQAFQEVLAPLGLGYSYERYVERYIGFDDRDALREAFRVSNRRLDGETLAKLLQAKAQAFLKTAARGVQAFPGAVALVQDLVAHQVPLAIASGALRQEIEAILEGLGLRHAFPIIVAANDVQRSKPDPESYRVALQRLQATYGAARLGLGSCLVIEDTPNGILAAKQAGLHCIAVTHSSPAATLQAADCIVESLEQLSFQSLTRLLNNGGCRPVSAQPLQR